MNLTVCESRIALENMSEEVDNRPFSEQLKAWRAQKGISQPEAARVLEVPVKTLQNWEIGRNKPTSLSLKYLRGRLRR